MASPSECHAILESLSNNTPLEEVVPDSDEENLNDSGIAEHGELDEGAAVEEVRATKGFRSRTFIGPLTAEDEKRREANNLASRRSRRRKTAMKSVQKLEDKNIGNCEVFCLVRNKATGQSWYCGSDCFVEKFKVNQPLCDYNPGRCHDEFRKAKLTNTNTFGLPTNVAAVPGPVEASPDKPIRVQQRIMLQQLPLDQGPSTSMTGGTAVTAFTTSKSKKK